MKAVFQRVRRASVRVDGADFSSMNHAGLLVYLAVKKGDTEKSADWLCDKFLGLRIFEDTEGKMNLSVQDVKGGVMIVPEFTLYGDCTHGKRPGFDMSAPPDEANRLFEYFVRACREKHPDVFCGKFRARMEVESVNDGPVTFVIESPR
jgi:D-tyrosyl-tRNA(Tyr) deacylase